MVSIGSRCVGELLGLEAEFGGEEGVLLRHRGLRAVQAVEEELAKEWETDQTGARNAMLALGIDEEELVRAVGGGDVGVFAQFDVALRAEDHEAAVASGAESGGGEPIHAEVTRRAVVGEEVAFAEILEVRMRGVGDISGCSVNDFGVFGTGEKKELLALMAPDVAENAAVFLLLKEPGRSSRGTEAMRAGAEGLDDFSNGSGGDEMAGVDGALDMEALAVVNGIFLARGLASAAGLLELIEACEGSFVGKIIFPGVHDAATERAAFIGNGCRCDESHFGVIENFLQRTRRAGMGELFLERSHFVCIRIEDPLDLRASLDQTIALAVDVTMVEVCGSHHKLARLADRRRLTLWSVSHSISTHSFLGAKDSEAARKSMASESSSDIPIKRFVFRAGFRTRVQWLFAELSGCLLKTGLAQRRGDAEDGES